MPITHAFVSGKGDGADTTLVRPVDWNAAHAGGITKTAAATIAAGPDETWLVLAANSADITGLTLTTVMEITALPVGRYWFDCHLIFQTTVNTTGIGVAVNFTGTSTQRLFECKWSDTLATATTGGVLNASAVVAGNCRGSQVSILNNTLIGTVRVSVQTANTDHLMNISGMLVVSVAGALQIKLEAELAALVCRAMQGSTLILRKFS